MLRGCRRRASGVADIKGSQFLITAKVGRHNIRQRTVPVYFLLIRSLWKRAGTDKNIPVSRASIKGKHSFADIDDMMRFA